MRNVTAPANAEDALESLCVINPRKDYSCFTFKVNHKKKLWRDTGFMSFAVHRLNHCAKTHEEVNILISSLFGGVARFIAVGIWIRRNQITEAAMPEPFLSPSWEDVAFRCTFRCNP